MPSFFSPAATAHRPWPAPRSPWVMAMRWHDLLFAHWPVDPARLRSHIPSGLELQTFEGSAWLGIVPFVMRSTRARCLPPLPLTSTFPELNVRTYVTHSGKPGVWFFSLDAASRLAVRAARRFYRLPYYDARMSSIRNANEVIYSSTRTHRAASAAEFRARYQPIGPPQISQPGSLEHWLTERYCLYAAAPTGQLYRGEIHHLPWPLQPARAQIERNTMAAPIGIELAGPPPLLHFAARLDVVAWLLHAVDS